MLEESGVAATEYGNHIPDCFSWFNEAWNVLDHMDGCHQDAGKSIHRGLKAAPYRKAKVRTAKRR